METDNIDSLATVNFFLGCVGTVQVSRIFLYRRSVDGSSAAAAKDLEGEVTGEAKAVEKTAEKAAKSS